MNIEKRLYELQDKEYAAFQVKLTPGISAGTVIGVRIPELRKLAKEYAKDPEMPTFLQALPHAYYDENLLHAILVAQLRSYEDCVSYLDAFLPYVDNWAVCDTLLPISFKKHKEELAGKIPQWVSSKEAFTCRFGLHMIMTSFLDEDFRPELLQLAAGVHREEYYVNMMIAWLFATALAKQWDAVIPFLTEGQLDVWTHNKTIQKAVESYRITPEQKAYLRSLKRK